MWRGDIKRLIFTAFAAAAVGVLLAAMIGTPSPSEAALLERGDRAQVVIGKDDDNTNNTKVQPPGTAANQSLNNTDVISSGDGNDVLVGLLGSDVMQGQNHNDILVGGTEQFTPPNSDVMFGGSGNDTSVWAPGDGSDAFLGATSLAAHGSGAPARHADS